MTVHYIDSQVMLHHGDALEILRTMPSESVHCVVTSPPYYGLRDYGEPGQYGLEASLAEYVETMLGVFAEVRRVLTVDGTLWLNLGDSYARGNLQGGARPSFRGDGALVSPARRHGGSLSNKSLLGVPWRVAFALQDDGWTLRNDIVWHKPNAMPESVTDRLSCRYEHVFLLTKSSRYHFDLDAIREPLAHPEALDGSRVFGGKAAGAGGVGATTRRRGAHRSVYGATDDGVSKRGRNPGDMWSMSTRPFAEAHFAVMAWPVVERCILAGSREGAIVLDPFSGSGTTGMVALKHCRRYVGIDLSAEYLDLSLRTRLDRKR